MNVTPCNYQNSYHASSSPEIEGLQNNPELQSNIAVAEDLYKYVPSKVVYATNITTPLLDREIREIKAKDPENAPSLINNKIENIRAIQEDLLKATSPLKGLSLEAEAALIEKAGVGNCLQMMKVARAHADSCGYKKVEIFRVEGYGPDARKCGKQCKHKESHMGNHAFIVIGRPYHSDPNNPAGWGDAVVYDGWAGCVPGAKAIYPAVEIPSNLQNYVNVGQEEDTRELWTRLEPFNSDEHFLFPMDF